MTKLTAKERRQPLGTFRDYLDIHGFINDPRNAREDYYNRGLQRAAEIFDAWFAAYKKDQKAKP